MNAARASSSWSDVPCSTTHDVVVVGNGPIGSAVARHVAESGSSVLVVDARDTLTSAHDDMGRIVRPLDAEGRERWQGWNVDSINAFPQMERQSGIVFFRKCGSLTCGTEAFVEKPSRLMTEAGVPFVRHEDGKDVEKSFPYLNVPLTHIAVSDKVGGFVDPKRMIDAQNKLMLSDPKNAVARESAVSVDAASGELAVVRTSDDATRSAKVIVLSGGAYTRYLAETSGLSVAKDSNADSTDANTVSPDASSGVHKIRLSRRTVLLAEVTDTEANGALRAMPTVKYQFAPESKPGDGSNFSSSGTSAHSKNEAMSVYVLPPILYPGPDPPTGWYVKIGGGPNDFFEEERTGNAIEDLDEWMRSEGDESVADKLHDVLLSLMPSTNFLALLSKPCVTTCTDDGELQCDALGDGGNVIAVSGCQGKAAGPADAIGKAVASEVLETLRGK